MSIGSRIKGLRLARGLTQVQLAERVKITQGSLSAIEKGHTKELKARTILAFAKALNTSAEWLKTGAGSPGEPITPDPEMVEAVHILGALSHEGREKWLSFGRYILSEETKAPTPAQPFVKAS